MSNAKDMQEHETRMLMANSITSVLVYRFPWLRVSPRADAALRSYLCGAMARSNESGPTVESAMGAILDALQTENEEVKRQFADYVANHGPPKVR